MTEPAIAVFSRMAAIGHQHTEFQISKVAIRDCARLGIEVRQAGTANKMH